MMILIENDIILILGNDETQARDELQDVEGEDGS